MIRTNKEGQEYGIIALYRKTEEDTVYEIEKIATLGNMVAIRTITYMIQTYIPPIQWLLKIEFEERIKDFEKIIE